MKKLVKLFTVLGILFMVVGCSSKEEKIVIGIAQKHMNTPYPVAVIEEFKAEVEKRGLGWEVIAADGQSNPAKQINDIEDFIAKGVDLIIMSPTQADPLTPVAKKVMEAKIPLILIDRTISSDDYTAFIGGDNINAGRVVAEYVNKKLNGEANIVEIQGSLGASATNDRHKGFNEIIAKNPGLKIIADTQADYKRDLALTVMEDILQAHNEIDVVYTHSDNMALGVMNPIVSVGRTDEMMVFGTDGQKEVFDAIKAGKIEGTVFYPTAAVEAVEYAEKILKGEKVEKIWLLDTPLITKENVDEWYDRGF